MTRTAKTPDAVASLWSVLSLAAALSFAVNILMLTGPLFMLQVYDRVLPSKSGETLVMLVVIAGGLLAALAFFDVLRTRVLARIGLKADAKLKADVWRAAHAHKLRTGDGRGRATLRDLDVLRQFISGQALVSFFDAPWVPIYLGIVFLLHPMLGLVALCGAFVLLVLALLNEWSTRKRIEHGTAKLTAASALADTGLDNAEAVHAMGMTDRLRDKWSAGRDDALADHTRANDRLGTLTSLSKGIRLFLQVAILGVGAVLAIQEVITPGAMIAASIIMGRGLAPVEQSISNWRSFVGARAAHRRIRRLIETYPARTDPMPLPEPAGRLQVEDAVLATPDGKTALLKKLSFSLEPGEALGVIGPSAAGKSCLARMLVGIWAPVSGSVRLDGAALGAWEPNALGRHIGYLPQDVALFDGSVRENIARLDADAPADAIVQAAQRAGVHETILRLPAGYDTPIGERGSVLSAGQRQRIGLARALYGDPALVVLDEPNSNLDAEGEAALSAAIRDLKARGRTVVVMAHRPSAISAVDKVLVLGDGAIQAIGPKDEVLAGLLRQAPGAPAPNTASEPTPATGARRARAHAPSIGARS